MPSLQEHSPITTTHLKIEIAYACKMALTPFAYKMCAKLKEEGLNALCSPCHVGKSMKKPPSLKGKTCLLRINRNKNYLLLKLQLSLQPPRKSSL
jgi:hypothetical protein